MMRLWVGTAGYAYPAWVGDFYPAGTPPADQLAYYAGHFPAVEVNSSFYRPPTPAQVRRMAARVPAGFGFTLKLPRSASHGYEPGDLPAFRHAAEALAEGGHLLGLVVQFPETFRNLPSDRDWLVKVRQAVAGFPLAVEFRHRSWDVPALPAWAARHALTVAGVGVPDLPQLFPDGPRHAGRLLYARLHGRAAEAWYAGGAARYDYDYPPAELGRWAAGLRQAAADGVERGLVFFNNCVGVQAVENARRLTALLSGAPGVEVVRPPAPPRRGLFDDFA
jgi:uncharacterized protein YecE (DUF72 family)